MIQSSSSSGKLLRGTPSGESERDGGAPEMTRQTAVANVLIGLAAAVLIALMLMPRIPLLKKGDVAPHDITAPYTFYLEYPGPEQTTLSYRVEKGELIIQSGHRVTERASRILAEIARREGVGKQLNAFAGLFLLLLLFFYLFYRDVKRYRPALVQDTRKLFLLAFLLVFTLAISQFIRYVFLLIADKLQLDPATAGFALPVAAGAMLVSLLLDFHITLGFTFGLSLLLGVLFHGDPFIAMYYFLGSIVSGLVVVRSKKRTAVLRAGALTALANMLMVVSIDLYRGALLANGWYDIAAGVIGALTATMIVSVSLPFFEAIFDIATDIKLLELLDPNQPLLRKLVYTSPGTYHHSIVIGNLAEAAAEAVGENPLLARVGAYYHDIGKIRKPEYFIENQRSMENKHDKLAPSMSSLIIASHVKDGLELGRENNLPSTVTDIIQQHHGTSLITYFYQKARDLQPLAVISEEDYRYAGPRPRTKVAAIVMLADAVEAASRTLDDPTPQRIQSLTNSVITRIFLDDQLSRCDLTLKDLREIARIFNIVLNGIFHQRIDYPGAEFGREKKRSDHQDRKHPEETRIGHAKHKEDLGEDPAGPRTS